MEIDVLGTTFTDVVVKIDHLDMKFDNLVFSEQAKISAGGNGSNVAINLSKNDIHINYHGLIGNDHGGQVIVSEFDKYKINYDSTNFITNGSTGISLVLVEKSGEKAIASYQGLNDNYDELELHKINNSVAVCGLGLMPKFEKNRLKEVFKHTKIIHKNSYAGTSANVTKMKSYLLNGSLCNLDFLFLNAREILDAAKLDDIQEAARFILKNGVKNVIVTEGKNGATLFRRNCTPIHKNSPYVKAVDTTGAGDAFMSGFIMEFEKNGDYSRALVKGNELGSINVMSIGAINN
ncbi:MAG: carbohydrate kinase family protein [Lactobacillus iners]|jgi:ribokinase|nr:carbohydrate kinase family protein [Lactobacillus iners]MCT7809987.1 carbohydrate kinase family protein [Lactobacillus iners]MCT7813868.1 carbohydrate kinase family protein [Lactobacillus iners]MCT7830094.1 carbohydrate kinase family protein [Lactobacillus iners]MCT7844169.1 carbohydrate kinase family protein [Lactobacillus iners]